MSRLVTPLVATPWMVQGSSQWSKERSEKLSNEFLEGWRLVFLLLSTGYYLMPVVLTSRLDPRNINWCIPYNTPSISWCSQANGKHISEHFSIDTAKIGFKAFSIAHYKMDMHYISGIGKNKGLVLLRTQQNDVLLRYFSFGMAFGARIKTWRLLDVSDVSAKGNVANIWPHVTVYIWLLNCRYQLCGEIWQQTKNRAVLPRRAHVPRIIDCRYPDGWPWLQEIQYPLQTHPKGEQKPSRN